MARHKHEGEKAGQHEGHAHDHHAHVDVAEAARRGVPAADVADFEVGAGQGVLIENDPLDVLDAPRLS